MSCLAVLYGCGGGGGGSTDVPGGSVSHADYGPISVEMKGQAAQPVVAGAGSATVTSVFAASFTDIKVRMPPASALTVEEALAETTIAYNKGGVVYYFEYGTGRTYPVTNLQSFGNQSYPSFSGMGDKFVVTEQDGDNIRWQIFRYNVDGSGRTRLTNHAQSSNIPSYSPDGTRIVFERANADSPYTRQIYRVNADGTGLLQLTDNADDNTRATWSPDGTKVAWYRRVNNTGDYYVHTMNPNGTGKVSVGLLSTSLPGGLDYTVAGTHLIHTWWNGTKHLVYRSISGGPVYTPENSLGGVSASPAGNYAVVSDGDTLKMVDLVDGSSRVLLYNAGTNPAWGPYVTTRRMVGGGGPLGAAAGGFSFAQLGKKVSSFVTYDAVTRSTLRVTPEGQTGSANVVLKLEGDTINSLRFLNDFRETPTVIVSNSTSSHVKGALIAFDSATGDVASVVTYVTGAAVRSRAGEPYTFEGRFEGVWDQEGKNLAPSGATIVTLDPQNGKVLSFR
ncbi:MAG TPA: hypothetical protein VGE01_08315 [Fimbriimonas sp.]